jgi:hypothetical protein
MPLPETNDRPQPELTEPPSVNVPSPATVLAVPESDTTDPELCPVLSLKKRPLTFCPTSFWFTIKFCMAIVTRFRLVVIVAVAFCSVSPLPMSTVYVTTEALATLVDRKIKANARPVSLHALCAVDPI